MRRVTGVGLQMISSEVSCVSDPVSDASGVGPGQYTALCRTSIISRDNKPLYLSLPVMTGSLLLLVSHGESQW